MVRDYVKPQYRVVEYTMSNGKKRYEVHVTNSGSGNTLVTYTGERRKPNNKISFRYLKHQIKGIMDRHDKLVFKQWLRELSQIN